MLKNPDRLDGVVERTREITLRQEHLADIEVGRREVVLPAGISGREDGAMGSTSR